MPMYLPTRSLQQSPWENQHQPHGRCPGACRKYVKVVTGDKIELCDVLDNILCTYLVDKTIVKEVMQEKEMI